MQRRKKILLWIAAVSCAFLILVLALQIIIPRMVNLESFRDKIQTTLSMAIGSKVTFERLDFSFVPRPCVKLRFLRISNPGRIEGTIDTLNVYPRILPLFTGKLLIAQIDAVAPDIAFRIPEKSAQNKIVMQSVTLAAFRHAIAEAGKDLASQAPSLALVIERGRVAVSYATNPPFTAEHLEARVVLPPKGLSITVNCNSSFWKNLSVDAKVDLQTLASDGSLSVEELKPHMLNPYLFPNGTSPIGDSQVDLVMSLKTDGVKNFRTDVRGSASHLRILRSRQALLIEDAQFRGSVVHDDQKTAIILNQLKAASPLVTFEGAMHSDVTVPSVDLTVTGKNIDVKALRQAILFFAQDSRTINRIFDVLRSGMVPAITFASTGRTPSDLGILEQMHITGSLQDGNIEIHGTPFRLTNVAGNVVITKGILEGDRLTARFGNTLAQNGTMRLGLMSGDAPFHLDIMMQADLAQLPPVLKAFVRDQSFIRELDMFRDVKGIAKGRLILGDSTKSIRATADISSFELNAVYHHIPFPVELRGGRLFYDEKHLLVEHIRGSVGKSSFTEFVARLNLAAPFDLEITSAQIAFFLDELYNWLPTFTPIKEALKDIETVQGTALLSIQHASLPLAKPETVRFSATGSVKNLMLSSKDFPGPLTIAAGHFKADTETISFTDAETDLMDASLKISGRLNGHLMAIQGGELTVTGTLGEEAVQWLSKKFSLPSRLAVHTHEISQTHLAWQGKDTVSCAGTFNFRNGPTVTLDLARDPHKLAINALRIQDGDSRADIRLMIEKEDLDITFSGTLQERTLKQIFTNEPYQYGRLSGNLQAHIPLGSIQQSTANGTFEGEHLLLPFELKIPTMIDHISFKANGNAITVGSAKISIGDAHLYSSGTITASSAGYLIDGDLSADNVAADIITAALDNQIGQEGEKQTENESPKKTWDLPLRGTVRFSTGTISYGTLSAGPVLADINLSTDNVRATIKEATLCSISLPGTVTITPRDIALDFSPVAERQNLESSQACLGSKNRATGTFTFKGHLMSRGTATTLLQSLQGKVEYTANDGLIYDDRVMVKILSFLSVNQLVSGKLPNPTIEGVPYTASVLKGTIKDGILNISEYSIAGPVVDIAGQGNVDIAKKTFDVTVVVAPLTTTTAIVKNIPGVNYILNGTLVTFPLHVYGPFDNVAVSYHPVNAVGEGIFGIMKRIVTIPLKPFESKNNEE